MIKDNIPKTDGLYHISLMGGEARAILCSSTALVDHARMVHTLSRVATAALGRLLTQTVMMGTMLKGEGDSITTRIKGGGPLGTLLAVARSDGSVKGYVENPAVDLPRVGGKLPVGDAVGRAGKLTVIKDLGLREPYSGQVHLVSGEIAEDFAMYYTASEQTPSLVSLGVLTGDTVVASGGLIVQMMPGASEAAIASIEHSAPMFVNISGTIQEYGLEGSVAQLLMHLEPEILLERSIEYRCDCGRERIERALISLGQSELQEMIDEQDGAKVDCHFCNKRYHFTGEALKTLLHNATRP